MTNGQDARRQLARLIQERQQTMPELVDMNALARKGRFNPVLGRESEIEEVLEILNQQRKANPLLIGPAGAGKTAVVEGLAQVLVQLSDRLPHRLRGCRILRMDTADLVADTGVVGELEKRIKQLTDHLKNKPGTILFIDEIHTLYGAGAGGRSQADAANLLKPLLAREDIRLIGATTDVEYNGIIRRDPAFERRLSPVYIKPMDESNTTSALAAYCRFRNWKVSDEVLEAIPKMAQRALPQRMLPDCAMDLLERAMSITLLQGRNTLDKGSIEKAMLRVARLPQDLGHRLERAAAVLPRVEEIGQALLDVLWGLKPPPVICECDDMRKAERLADVLGDCLGGIVEVDIDWQDREELLGTGHSVTGYGDRRALHGLVERPYSVVLVRGTDQPGPNGVLLEDIRRGRIVDGEGRHLTTNVVITAPRQVKHIGFCR